MLEIENDMVNWLTNQIFRSCLKLKMIWSIGLISISMFHMQQFYTDQLISLKFMDPKCVMFKFNHIS